MPGGDRTGPLGAGPRTGRAAGYCAGYGMPGYMNPTGGHGFGYGRGFGLGRGFGRGFGGGGRGWRHRYYATGVPGLARPYPDYADYYQAPPVQPEQASAGELSYLKEQARYFNEMLNDINKRIEQLEKKQDL
jgi:hypothetical protein